ncbi:homeobox-leucine zipper protein REVOLUTA [Trifolium repens]|nr:homeobox-leucine zipper protein REVOLUTA [Trifolium repens]
MQRSEAACHDIDNSGKYVRYTAEQIEALEKVYVECPKPSSMSMQQLIQENPVLFNIEPEQIKVWFKNRRCRETLRKEASELQTYGNTKKRLFYSLREVGGEIEEEPNTAVVDKAIYVAVSKDVKESKLNLIWAIQNSGGKKICILFVHAPATLIPLNEASQQPSLASWLPTKKQQSHRSIKSYTQNVQLIEDLRFTTATTKIKATPDGEYIIASGTPIRAEPETVQKVCDIVKNQLALPEGSDVTGESKFSTLGADSLNTKCCGFV